MHCRGFQQFMQQHHWCVTGLQLYNMLVDGRSLSLSEETVRLRLKNTID
jgi:hypothetical protein